MTCSLRSKMIIWDLLVGWGRGEWVGGGGGGGGGVEVNGLKVGVGVGVEVNGLEVGVGLGGFQCV